MASTRAFHLSLRLVIAVMLICAGLVVTPLTALAAGTWGNAVTVPGSLSLNAGGGAQVTAVSCPSAGNCSAGGYYSPSQGHPQAFVANRVNGVWRTAAAVPGIAAL